MLVLTVTAGPDPGRNLELQGDRPLIFGRFSIIGDEVDPKLSRRHALFRRDGHRWLVQDLGSRNGTFVNGTAIEQPTRLRAGDEVRLGRTVLSVAVLGEDAAAPGPAPGPAPSPAPAREPAVATDAMEAPQASQPAEAVPDSVVDTRPATPLQCPTDGSRVGDFVDELHAADAVLDAPDQAPAESATDQTLAGHLVEMPDEDDEDVVAAEAVALPDMPQPVDETDLSEIDAARDAAWEESAPDEFAIEVEFEAEPVLAASASDQPGEAATPAMAATEPVARPAAQAAGEPLPVRRRRRRRVARYVVLGVLLLAGGLTAAVLLPSMSHTQPKGESPQDPLARAEEAAREAPVPDPAASVPVTPAPVPPSAANPVTAPRTAPTPPAPAPAPTPAATAVREVPSPTAPTPAPWTRPEPTPEPTGSSNLDPYRAVDTFSSAMTSQSRVSLPDRAQRPAAEASPAPASPEPAAPVTSVPDSPPPADVVPDMPAPPPVVASRVPTVEPAAEVPEAPRARRARSERAQVRPAPLDDADRVVFVVDASGSMIDTLPLVLQELDRMIAQLHPDQRFTVLFYQKDQVIEVEPTGMKEATRRNKTQVSRWMDPKAGHIFAVGPSYPLAAIKAAMDYQPDQVFLLADKIGVSLRAKEQSQQFLRELAEVNPGKSVQINTVHFFYPDPNQALASVASGHEGTYRFVTLDEVASESTRGDDPLRDNLMILLEGQ